MALLGGLRVVKRLAWVFEISARVLTIGVKEQIVKTRVQIIVTRNIYFRVLAIVPLMQSSERRHEVC